MNASSHADRFVDALHALDAGRDGAVDRMVGLFADDASLLNPALEHEGDPRHGSAGARAFWQSYAAMFEGARTEFAQVLADADGAALFWTTEREQPPLRYDGATWLRFDGDGRIVQLRGYYDPRQLQG